MSNLIRLPSNKVLNIERVTVIEIYETSVIVWFANNDSYTFNGEDIEEIKKNLP